MGRKKHKKHPKQGSQAKRKEAPVGNNLPYKSGLSGAISHALSTGWVQNSGVGFLFFFIALMVALMFSSQVKAAAVTFALAGTVFLWILAGVVIRYSNEPQGIAFSLLFKIFEGSHNPTHGVFWCRYQSGFGDTLSPAPAVLYLTVKNMNPSPLLIENLEVSVQKKGEGWVPLRNIPADGCKWYWIYGDPTKAALLDMATLEPRIHSSIPAGETVPGWMFLATTKEYPATEGDSVRWRLRSKDSAGVESEYISPYEVINNRPDSITGARLPVPFTVSGLREDLSKLFVRNYEPLPYK